MNARAAIFAVSIAALVGGKREERRFAETTLLSGDAPTTPGIEAPYMNNAWAMNEGSQLFRWFNCVGCYSHDGVAWARNGPAGR